MPRFKQLSQILSLMNDKASIRNVGIIAHIDHGKTTLTDSLLAGAGLISPSMAGTARVLDYLEEEQKRKITIKTAHISLVYKGHVVNLVDTPGHVDFTGKVTRALRAIDGAIVVVDAVEGIMAQTEIVTRKALIERVRPVLFVNKIDRLVTELQLTAEQIEKRLKSLVDGFNDLVELYADDDAFKQEWKVNPASDTAAFGSALHGWGFTLTMAKQKQVKFTDIIAAYKANQQERLREVLPVHEAIFNMAINCIPDPKQAQMYRIEAIWDGRVDSKVGQLMTECSDDGPAVAYITNVQRNPDDTTLATVRVFSGVVRKGISLRLVEAQSDTRIDGAYVQMGAFREEAEEVTAGNVAVLKLAGSVRATETLVDPEHEAEMAPFEGISYVSEPVVTVAVEPRNPKDLPGLQEALDSLVLEDPNLSVKADVETGEYLLNGMGELHLEIALKQLGAKVAVTASEPRVAYRETVTKKGIDAKARSPNKQNTFKLRLEPLAEDEKTLVQGGECDGVVLAVDEFRNVFVDACGKAGTLDEAVLESVIAGFEFACHAGPLCGEPMRHVKVSVLDLVIADDSALRGSVEIMRTVGKAVFGSFLTAKPALLEPIYKTIITAPVELVGECERIVAARRGKVSAFETRGLFAVVTAHVPVAESFGLSREFRSTTSGRAFWESSFEHWESLPEKLAADVVVEMRMKKGLPAEVPKPEVFLEAER